jgi:ABC-type spermidine/putrescine transport system permease subunit I
MSPRSIAFCASFVVAIAFALLVDRLIRPSLQQLLEEITVLPAATEFYLRSFAIVVFFVAGSSALGSAHGDLSATSRFMEYVWSTADTLKSAMEGIFGVLLGYVAMITILVAALRRRQQ